MTRLPTLTELENKQEFLARHIGPDATQQQEMLSVIGADSLEDMTTKIVPESILLKEGLKVGESQTEVEALANLRKFADQNQVLKTYIGMGYSNTHTPNVILRNVLENPGWYTAYTPYQPEIAQGRLEAILNFQQLTLDLTGLELASSSLLDEATAGAEAMALAKRVSKNKKSDLFFVSDGVHPQIIDVVKTRAVGFGFEVLVGPASDSVNHDIFGAILSYPTTTGSVDDIEQLITDLKAKKAVVALSTDFMALTLLKSPGELGADVAFGNSQRFGVPMGFGGPHAAFFATLDKHKRSVPGRIIGVSKDTRGKPALRMAMQTREQHIRREKANSNICTAQVLLANMASFYAVYHGPKGLKNIATRINRLATVLANGLTSKGAELANDTWFDTITLNVGEDKDALLASGVAAGVNFRRDLAGQIGISVDETTTRDDIAQLFDVILGESHGLDVAALDSEVTGQSFSTNLVRTSQYLSHDVFNKYHSETEMMRYIRRLEGKDLALNHSMISLGSCTMKLNAVAEMLPVSWNEFSNMHPFCPQDQAAGYVGMIDELALWLADITGYDAICMQPNSGAQGEYAGLLAIQKYHESRGEGHRNICLIPASAHGTNPASAQMIGMKVVVTACDNEGNVDMDDLRSKAEELSDSLSCIMITYPSTHGVFEDTIGDICDLIHANGGQVYLDGANMNAQVGVTSPGFIGADVSHLNLHKTFAIPHGGGGPGMGPIGVKQHLAPFVANHSVIDLSAEGKGPDSGNGALSGAQYGSASILPITYMYIAMLGTEGLRKSTQVAILNANYLKERLSAHYPILYSGQGGYVAHECIVDLRPLKEASGVTEMDIAKRLNDYGFHAPTMSFPVAGTLMIEPTESESKVEIDRLADALIAIRAEIAKVESGEWTDTDNPLHNAPHTMDDIMDPTWSRAYDRQVAVFPTTEVRNNKFWPTVNRIDDVYGDRNLHCSCVPIDEYID